MEKTLFNKEGDPVAYISDDYNETIFLWDGSPVAYLYDEYHVYGINGRHLGWRIEDILYNNDGERIGFTSSNCPVAIAKEPTKTRKQPIDEIRPRWKAPPLPKLSFDLAGLDLVDYLQEGQVVRYYEESPAEESKD